MIEIIKENQLSQAGEILNDFNEYALYRRRSWEKTAEKAEKYYMGNQWDNKDKQILFNSKRVPAVFNKILPAIDLIVGHFMQNKIDMIPKPVDSEADVEVAHILSAVIKNLYWQNCIKYEDKFHFLDGIITGFGAEEIWYDPLYNMDGLIRFKQTSPWHYYLDPSVEKYDYTDGEKVFKETWMKLEDIERIYGKKIAKQITFKSRDLKISMPIYDVRATWDSNKKDYGNLDMRNITEESFSHAGFDIKNNRIRVIEEYKMVHEKVELYYDIESGRYKKLDDLTEEESDMFKNLSIPTYLKHIKLTTIIADDIIAHEENLKAEEFYHIFSFYFPYWINGKYFGLIENLFYPQDEINKRHSTIVHILGTFANSGIFYEKGAFPEDVEAELENLLSQNGVAIQMNEDGISKIKPIVPHDIPQTLMGLIIQSDTYIKNISGAEDALAGRAPREESGRAKESMIQQAAVKLSGAIGNYWYTQVLRAKGLLWQIQNNYTDERIVRILNEHTNQMEEIILNKRMTLDKVANDITTGMYDITFEPEAITQSERERNKYMTIELMKAVPEFRDIFAELYVKLSDHPEKENILAQINQRRQMMMQQQQATGVQGMPQKSIRGATNRPSRYFGTKRLPANIDRTQGQSISRPLQGQKP